MSLLASTTGQLVMDITWFVLLCAIFAFIRFHAWRKNQKVLIGWKEPHGKASADSRKKAA